MSTLSAHLSWLFTEVPFLERFAAAKAVGFDNVEFAFEFEHPPLQVAEQLRAHNLNLSLLNSPAGDWDRGERGLAALPDRTEEFRDSIAMTADFAGTTQATCVNCLAGNYDRRWSVSEQRRTLIKNYLHAADSLPDHTVVIETLNPIDHPDYILPRLADAVDVVREVDRPNIRLLFDVYHVQRTEGDIIRRLADAMPIIGHVHVADVPDRHEPGTGEINYERVLDALTEQGYKGRVGLEYTPSTDTLSSLNWTPLGRGDTTP
jgi:hydroxypyruvate isomerase